MEEETGESGSKDQLMGLSNPRNEARALGTVDIIRKPPTGTGRGQGKTQTGTGIVSDGLAGASSSEESDGEESPYKEEDIEIKTFFEKILMDGDHRAIIEWIDEDDRKFKILDSMAVAKLWGKQQKTLEEREEDDEDDQKRFEKVVKINCNFGVLKLDAKQQIYQLSP